MEPIDEGGARITFQRRGDELVMSGSTSELSRIVAGSISVLASLPSRTNGVLTHVHLDPTTDSEGRYYSPESTSLVVSFGGDEDD